MCTPCYVQEGHLLTAISDTVSKLQQPSPSPTSLNPLPILSPQCHPPKQFSNATHLSRIFSYCWNVLSPHL